MKIVQINTFCGVGSVGRICVDLYDVLEREGHEPYIAIGRGKLPEHIRGFKNGNLWDFGWHVMKNFFQGKAGFGSAKTTKKLIAWLETVRPDVIHLHNIHGFYLQTELLFDYLKKSGAAVIWTLHDCWTFTGHCAYFDYIGCDKWQRGCEKCKVHASAYPYALFKDNTKWNYAAKKEAYTGVPNLTVVTPSRWLADMVKKSYLKDYPVEVIPNGINLDVFCPAEAVEASQTESVHGGEKASGQYNILGVANIWEERKGLVYFEQLAEKMPEGYVIRLVGVNDRQEKQLRKKFPDGKIVPIKRTKNVQQLAQLYREADVYVNATMEDNFPTTNLEALACGTPVVTFKTGGSPESLDEKCGIVVPKGDVDALLTAVRKVCEEKPFARKDCRRKALAYGRNERYMQYISLYESVL